MAKKESAGAPAWMATFADLMSLLLCFFVLLLSFSELDVQRYRQVAGSMREAFGVQREVFAKETPMGTSFVAREFSPGRPHSSPLTIVSQATAPSQQQYLEVEKEGLPQGDTGAGQAEAAGLGEKQDDFKEAGTQGEAVPQQKPAIPQDESEASQEAGEKVTGDEQGYDLERIKQELEAEIQKGLVQIFQQGRKITIRVQEKASFPPGSATLLEPFNTVLGKVARILEFIEGKIIVSGHTDNAPFRSGNYRSNWDLSSARAVSVVHRLLQEGVIEAKRLEARGVADVEPIANNNSPEGRALNRRVEIVILKGKDIELDDRDF
jgi:chemotaxis protein MotB